MTIRFQSFAAFSLCVASLLWHAPSNAFASTTAPPAGKVVLQPCDQQGNIVPGSGYFQINAAAGSSTQLYALVGNVGKKRFTVSVAPVDARSGVYGGISYNLPQQHRTRVGSWLKLSMSTVVVHPGRAALVAFTVQVPAGTTGGQYIGGLTAYVPAHVSAVSGAASQRDGSIIVQLRRVVAVVVTVPGQSYGRFAVSRVNAKQRPDAIYLISHIRNTGTLLLTGQGTLWMWKLGIKKPILKAPIALDTTVPTTTVLYPILWAKHPSPGTYSITISIKWAGGKTTRKSTFVWPAPKH